MARKIHDDALGVIGAETIIGTGVVVNGNLESDADISIDGTLTGDLKAAGDVAIGINAKVKGNITATNITVAGNVTGNLTASGETRIAESGHVKGDIAASGIAINSGGIFIGRSIMQATPKLLGEHPSDDEPTDTQPSVRSH